MGSSTPPSPKDGAANRAAVARTRAAKRAAGLVPKERWAHRSWSWMTSDPPARLRSAARAEGARAYLPSVRPVFRVRLNAFSASRSSHADMPKPSARAASWICCFSSGVTRNMI